MRRRVFKGGRAFEWPTFLCTYFLYLPFSCKWFQGESFLMRNSRPLSLLSPRHWFSFAAYDEAPDTVLHFSKLFHRTVKCSLLSTESKWASGGSANPPTGNGAQIIVSKAFPFRLPLYDSLCLPQRNYYCLCCLLITDFSDESSKSLGEEINPWKWFSFDTIDLKYSVNTDENIK